MGRKVLLQCPSSLETARSPMFDRILPRDELPEIQFPVSTYISKHNSKINKSENSHSPSHLVFNMGKTLLFRISLFRNSIISHVLQAGLQRSCSGFSFLNLGGIPKISPKWKCIGNSTCLEILSQHERRIVLFRFAVFRNSTIRHVWPNLSPKRFLASIHWSESK